MPVLGSLAGAPQLPIYAGNWDQLNQYLLGIQYDVVLNVKSFGALGNDSTDDTAAIQAALAAVPTDGGVVVFPPGRYPITSTLVPKQNTIVLGGGQSAPDGTHLGAAYLKGATLNGWMIDTSNVGVSVLGMTFGGLITTGGKGVRLNGAGSTIRDCFFSGFGDQALAMGGISGLVDNVQVQNACLVRTGRAAYVGCVEIRGDDITCRTITSTASYGSGPGGHITFFIAGILVTGSNNFLDSCVGHLSEAGIVVDTTGQYNKLTACRGDLNQTSSIVVLGTANSLTACHSYRDGRDADATYDAYNVQGRQNTFVGCYAIAESGDSVRCNNGFGDTNSGTGANRYVECQAINLRAQLINHTGTTLYPQRIFGTGSPLSVVIAPIGSTFNRLDGGAATSFYVKESGNGASTGWVAK